MNQFFYIFKLKLFNFWKLAKNQWHTLIHLKCLNKSKNFDKKFLGMNSFL